MGKSSSSISLPCSVSVFSVWNDLSASLIPQRFQWCIHVGMPMQRTNTILRIMSSERNRCTCIPEMHSNSEAGIGCKVSIPTTKCALYALCCSVLCSMVQFQIKELGKCLKGGHSVYIVHRARPTQIPGIYETQRTQTWDYQLARMMTCYVLADPPI